jgi:hypothetical protein
MGSPDFWFKSISKLAGWRPEHRNLWALRCRTAAPVRAGLIWSSEFGLGEVPMQPRNRRSDCATLARSGRPVFFFSGPKRPLSPAHYARKTGISSKVGHARSRQAPMPTCLCHAMLQPENTPRLPKSSMASRLVFDEWPLVGIHSRRQLRQCSLRRRGPSAMSKGGEIVGQMEVRGGMEIRDQPAQGSWR